MNSQTLRGMTWSHPRGYDPMIACSKLWRSRTGVEVVWDKRSLQDFESYPVEQLAETYDLIVIDHPHVGQITREGCLIPLDIPERASDATALEKASVGASYASYRWQGRQWALPIDAAAQVQAWRPDQIEAPAERWDDMLSLARRGRVQCPLRPPHSLMAFYTLSANLSRSCGVNGPDLIDPAAGQEVYQLLRELTSFIHADCFSMDPIAIFEAMATPESEIACAPLIYGYASYAREAFRPKRIAFADIAAIGSNGPVGSALGGTGIAVSARSRNAPEAIDFAYWIAGADAQSGPYAAAGGQPAHAAAWGSAAVNRPVADLYSTTRATLEGAWVRPRHNGYMSFQNAAAARLNDALLSGEDGRGFIAELNTMFQKSFEA